MLPNRVLLDCRGAGILVRRAHRTGPVTPTVKLGAGHGAGVSRSAGRDALMPPRLEDGLRDGRAVGRVPRDRGRSGGRTPARAHPASGLRLAAGPRNVGAAARRVRTLPAVTLSDTGGQEERTRSRLIVTLSRRYGPGRDGSERVVPLRCPGWLALEPPAAGPYWPGLALERRACLPGPRRGVARKRCEAQAVRN